MKKIKWIFLFYAILAAACIMGMGVAIAEKSMIGFAGCVVLLIFIMGSGFKTKKRMRENGQL
ncbi:MAG: YlaF family protein [Bacillota bacterium]|nr:YlaF family protein [Bacillota bacterium]MDP4170294.1 YlaF family protein [Bacillota bacterium]